MNGFHNYFLTHGGPLVVLLCLEKFQKHGFQPLSFNSMVGFSTLYFFQTLADCVELHFYSTFRKADIIFLIGLVQLTLSHDRAQQPETKGRQRPG